MNELDLKHWWSFGSKLSETSFDSKASYNENRMPSTGNNIDPKLLSKHLDSPTEEQKQHNSKWIVDSNIFDSAIVNDDVEYHGILTIMQCNISQHMKNLLKIIILAIASILGNLMEDLDVDETKIQFNNKVYYDEHTQYIKAISERPRSLSKSFNKKRNMKQL